MAIENAKTLNVRIRNKYDSYENWSSSNLVLEAGEIAIAYTTVDVKVGNGTAKHPALLMKVGDGEKTFANLPWMSAKAADVLEACKSTEALTTFVNNVIAEAGIASDEAMEALAGKVTTAEGAIDALEELVGSTKVSDQIDAKIAALNLSDTYAAKSHKHEVADVNGLSDALASKETAGEAAKVQTALETYKTSNDAAVQKNAADIAGEISRAKAAEEANTNAISAIKDGTTIDSFADVEGALAGKEIAGAAAAAEAAAKSYADGLAGNYDANGSAAAAESAAKAYAKEYADGLASNYDAAGAAAGALTEAKGYTDSEMTRLVGSKTVETQISEAITGLDLANTYDAKGAAAAVDAKLTTHASEAAAAYETKTDASSKLTEAKGYTDTEVAKVQGEVDALETYVGTIPTDEAYKDITDVVGYINKKAEETLAAASGNSTETAASVKQQLDNYKSENNTRVKAAEDAIDAIEADYLKAADKTELQGAIDALEALVGTENVATAIETAVNAEKERAMGIEGGLETRLAAVEGDYLKAADKTELEGKITSNANAIELLTNGVSAEEVDGVNDLIQYVKDHGTEVTGMKADIKAAADAAAAEKTRAEGVEADLQEAINGVAADVEELAGEVDTKAAQADLETLAGRVSTIEGDLNTETTGLKARMTAAEGNIDALEELVGTEKVADVVAAAIEALKIGDYAKAADLTSAVERIAAAEGKITTLEGEMDAAQADIEALETEVAKKANDADLATIAKTGSTDDLVQGELVLLFDCGGAN